MCKRTKNNFQRNCGFHFYMLHTEEVNYRISNYGNILEATVYCSQANFLKHLCF